MPMCGKMTVLVIGILVLTSVGVPPRPARADAPPPMIGEELQRAKNDFASGGVRRLTANWNACVDHARVSQDANGAERCVAYGYGALLLVQSVGGGAEGRYLTAD